MGEQKVPEFTRIVCLHFFFKKKGKTQTLHAEELTDSISRCLQCATEITYSEELSASCAKHFRNLANYLDT